MNKTLIRALDFAFVFIFYVGFQGGKYYLENRIQELGFVVVLILFSFGAIRLAMQRVDVKWSLWFWVTPLIISYPMIISSSAYYINTGSSFLYSFFATREFLIIYLAPTIFFIYKLGYPIDRIEKTFVISLILVIINYLFFYFFLDLAAMKWGSNLYMSQQVVYDPWRGYRLKPPTAGLFIGTSYCLILLAQKIDCVRKFGVIIFFFLLSFCWYILVQRTQIATIIVSFILFSILFSRPSRINILIFSFPIVVLVMLLFSGKMVEIFFEADAIRKMAAEICIEVINEKPILGMGTASYKGITYQDLFGKHFYPSDVGLIGVSFKYGMMGVCIYFYMLMLVMYRAVKMNWYYFFINNKKNPLLMALVIWVLGIFLNSILSPALVFMQGLMVASFIIGITTCYRDTFLQK